MGRLAFAALLLSTLSCAACANRPDAWYRAATNPDQASTDERACRDEATQVARESSRRDANILQDRSGSPGYNSAGVSQSDLDINPHDRLAVTERDNIRDLTRSCMGDRGYRLLRDD